MTSTFDLRPPQSNKALKMFLRDQVNKNGHDGPTDQQQQQQNNRRLETRRRWADGGTTDPQRGDVRGQKQN